MATLYLAARPRALHCRCSVTEPAAAAPVARRVVLSAATLLALRPGLPVSAAPASPALLHAVLRVKSLDAAAAFAVEALSMRILRSRPGNVFAGFGPESGGQNFSLEFEPTEDGAVALPGDDDFGGIVIAVDNPSKAAAKSTAAGARRASGGLRCSGDAIAGCAVGGVDELPLHVAFVKGAGPRLARVVLGVASLPRAVAFYKDALGMTELKSQTGVSDRAAEDPAPQARALLAFGNGKVALELRELNARSSSALFDKIAISVPDLPAAALRVEAASVGALVKPPFAVPGVGTRVAIVRDPDGHTLALVDASDFEKELVL